MATNYCLTKQQKVQIEQTLIGLEGVFIEEPGVWAQLGWQCYAASRAGVLHPTILGEGPYSRQLMDDYFKYWMLFAGRNKPWNTYTDEEVEAQEQYERDTFGEHEVILTNGQRLLIKEHDYHLTIASGDAGDETYIANIDKNGVMVYCNSHDACEFLTLGLLKV